MLPVDTDTCGEVSKVGLIKEPCARKQGHPGRHWTADESLSWEPTYAASLRSALEHAEEMVACVAQELHDGTTSNQEAADDLAIVCERARKAIEESQ